MSYTSLDSFDFITLKFPLTNRFPWEKNWPPWLLTVSSPWAHGDQNGHSQPWLSRDLGRRCDLPVTELWPSRDWAVTSPNHDWAVIIGPRSHDHRGHRELTVSSRWPFIFSWAASNYSLPRGLIPIQIYTQTWITGDNLWSVKVNKTL